jgi:hypothetical protein
MHDETAQIVGVTKPFTWMIIPYHGDGGNFRYVEKNQSYTAQPLDPDIQDMSSLHIDDPWPQPG